MLTLNDGRSELWQWDTGRKMTVDADCSQVHFSNKVFGRSIDVDVVDGVAIIPDTLLQVDKELTAWAFVGTAENGYTKISKTFKVNRRNKPSDYVFTPSEQTTLGELVERLDKIEESQDPDAIKNAVDDYLANNPIMVKETDPTVPEWAKQPNPPDVKIPDKLPNPYSITFTGAVDASYDGSTAVEVEIPDSGGNVAYDKEQQLTEEQKAQARANIGAQPAGEYLTEVPEGYAKNEDIEKVDRKVDTLREVVSKFHSNIVETASGDVIAVSDASDMELAGLRIFGKTTQNGTPTPEAPVSLESAGDSGNVGVTVTGKNLYNGGDLSVTGYKEVILSKPLPADTYTVSAICISNDTDSDRCLIAFIGGGSSSSSNANIFLTRDNRSSAVVTLPRPVSNVRFCASDSVSTASGDSVTFTDIQIEAGSAATEFEPYTDQTLILQKPTDVPVFLSGVRSTSNSGNYTDENGQGWFCDEVDFTKGVYLQRIVRYVFDGDEQWLNLNKTTRAYYIKIGDIGDYAHGFYCDKLSYGDVRDNNTEIGMRTVDSTARGGFCIYLRLPEEYAEVITIDAFKTWLAENPLTVYIALTEPIEIPLTDEELAQYAALHTNYPDTTIFNDGGADMEVKYVADTKLYIDKKFDQLAVAMLNQ